MLYFILNFQAIQQGILEKTEKYIPGLTDKPDDQMTIPKKSAPRRVPPTLVKAFMEGKKHPVSALNEYCSMVRSIVEYRDVAVNNPSIIAQFASVCTVDGVDYPQGTGRTKKDAKTAAGKVAFTAILNVGLDDIDEEIGKIGLFIDLTVILVTTPRYSSQSSNPLLPTVEVGSWGFSSQSSIRQLSQTNRDHCFSLSLIHI